VTYSTKNTETSSETYRTRLATLDDAPTLLEIGINTFRDTFASQNTPEDMAMYLAKTFTLDQLTQDLNDPACIFIVACDGQQIIGYAKLLEGKAPPSGLNEEHAIEIERIYSLQAYLGKNVGKTLIQHCLDVAQRKGFTTVWLGVWEHNPRAIAFYEKWGFTKFGSHPFLLGNDLQTDLLMKKNLE
jgi:diamine N-acetyltransferase